MYSQSYLPHLIDFIFDLLYSAPPGESLADISSELYQVPVTFTRNSSEDNIMQVSQHATLWEEPEEVLSRSINTHNKSDNSHREKRFIFKDYANNGE